MSVRTFPGINHDRRTRIGFWPLIAGSATVLAVLFSCAQVESVTPRTAFSDVTEPWGYDTERNAAYWTPFAGDFDGDGDLDVFVLGHQYQGRDPAIVNLIFQNQGDGRLTDVTASGLTPVTHSGNHGFVIDYDGDGKDDLMMAADQFSLDQFAGGVDDRNRIRFQRRDILSGHFSTAGLGDLDGDGRLDGYAGHPHPSYQDQAFIGRGSGMSADAAMTAQLANQANGAQTVWIGDLNNDRRSDVYYCEWWYDPEYLVALFYGKGEGKFDTVPDAGIPRNGGLLSFLDIDADGDLDALSDGKSGVRLFQNQGDGRFRETTEQSGLNGAPRDARTTWGDLDLDGDVDLLIKNRIYLNDGTGVFAPDLQLPIETKAVPADLDNDGDLDLITTKKIFRNDSSGKSWIKVKLIARSGQQPPIGAEFSLIDADRVVYYDQLTACDRRGLPPLWTIGVAGGTKYRIVARFPGITNPVTVDEVEAGETVYLSPDGPTPPPGSAVSVDLSMPAERFTAGAPCWLTANIRNEGDRLPEVPFFLALVVGDAAFFGPSFDQPGQLDYWTLNIEPGKTELTVIPEFLWPDGAGSGNAAFYSGAATPDLTRAISNLAVWNFNW